MDKNKKIMVGVVGLGLAGLAYFLFFKDKAEPTQTTGGKDGLDNPMTGSYQGNKPRSTGNSTTTTTTVQPTSGFSMCIPAMESEGGGMGKYISVDDPHTPGAVEIERRQIVHDNLNVGDTIDLDGRSCTIKKFWKDDGTKYPDGVGRKSAIACEDHSNITYNSNSQICW